MRAVPERLDLLLAADDGKPALEHGLPGDSAEKAPTQRMLDDGRRLRELLVPPAPGGMFGGPASDLPSQRWGVVAPEGPEGDQMLEAVEPLRKLREAEQHAPVRIFRVPAGMGAREARSWKESAYSCIEEAEQPYYMMLLGDMRQTSLDLQYALSTSALVGRVHFDGADGGSDLARYAAYADKIVRFAREAKHEPAGDLLYYVAEDGSAATIQGKVRLVAPAFEKSQKARIEIGAASVQRIEASTVSRLLSAASGARPSVLLSVSHGLGAPQSGWGSVEEQRRRQGALVIRHDEILDAERVAGQTFLPGGMWFLMACFGAGTPEESAYHLWLSELRRMDGYGGDLRAVLSSLPGPGERGFLASLPQAALANPRGPLAVIGHVDLAWTYAFSGGADLSQSREARIRTPLHILLRGDRAGVALNKLMDEYRVANDALTTSYQMQEQAHAEGKESPIPRAEIAHQWMMRNDLRAYVLLGDPAARLSVTPSFEWAAQQAMSAMDRVPELGADLASGSAPGPAPLYAEEKGRPRGVTTAVVVIAVVAGMAALLAAYMLLDPFNDDARTAPSPTAPRERSPKRQAPSHDGSAHPSSRSRPPAR